MDEHTLGKYEMRLAAHGLEAVSELARAIEHLAQAIDARSGKTGTGLIAEGDESAVA